MLDRHLGELWPIHLRLAKLLSAKGDEVPQIVEALKLPQTVEVLKLPQLTQTDWWHGSFMAVCGSADHFAPAVSQVQDVQGDKSRRFDLCAFYSI